MSYIVTSDASRRYELVAEKASNAPPGECHFCIVGRKLYVFLELLEHELYENGECVLHLPYFWEKTYAILGTVLQLKHFGENILVMDPCLFYRESDGSLVFVEYDWGGRINRFVIRPDGQKIRDYHAFFREDVKIPKEFLPRQP